MAPQIYTDRLQQIKIKLKTFWDRTVKPQSDELLEQIRFRPLFGAIYELNRYPKPIRYPAYFLLALVAFAVVALSVVFVVPFVILAYCVLNLVLVIPYVGRFLDWTYNLFTYDRFDAELRAGADTAPLFFFENLPKVASSLWDALKIWPDSVIGKILKPVQVIFSPVVLVLALVHDAANFAATFKGAVMIAALPLAIAVPITYVVLMTPLFLLDAARFCLGKSKPKYNPNPQQEDGDESHPGYRFFEVAKAKIGAVVAKQNNQAAALPALTPNPAPAVSEVSPALAAVAVPVAGPALAAGQVVQDQPVVSSAPPAIVPNFVSPLAAPVVKKKPDLHEFDLGRSALINPYDVIDNPSIAAMV